EFDNNVRRERCTTGMQAAAKRGRWVFPTPLGYRVALKPDGEKTLELQPETAPFIRQAFEMAATGLHGVGEILRELRRRGLAGRRGGPMTSTMLHKILRNPVYKGRVVVKSWGVDVAADFPALVDEECFDRAVRAITGVKPLLAAYQRNN